MATHTTAVWTVQNPTAAAAIDVTSRLGWAMLLVSIRFISQFEFFGLTQFCPPAWQGAEGAEVSYTFFYQRVRYPIYLSFLLAFWSTPLMTLGPSDLFHCDNQLHLHRIQLEERDLVRLFGDQYRCYQQRLRCSFRCLVADLLGRRLSQPTYSRSMELMTATRE